jgi:hypothetical protein
VETKLDRFAFEAAVVADAGGWASSAESAEVAADPLTWAATLRRLIHETDDGLRRASSLTGDLREVVLSDLNDERDRLAAVLRRLTGDEIDAPVLTQPGGPEASTRNGAGGADHHPGSGAPGGTGSSGSAGPTGGGA